MKKKERIGILIGIVLGLMMVMPSFVFADVTISGGTESSMVDLEGINNESVIPGPFTSQNGTTRNAYVTDSGAVNTSDTAALLTNANGWNVNVSEFGSLTGGDFGVLFDNDGNNPYLNGILTNYGSIYGGTHGAEMNYGTITNYGSLTAGIGSGAIFWSEGTGTATVTNSGTMSGGYDGLELYNPSTGTMTAIVTNNNGGTMSGYYNGIEFISAGAGTVTVTNSGLISGTDNGDGIALYSDDALTARIQNNLGGTIYSYWMGVNFYSVGAGDVQITNAGTITGDYDNGVYLFSEGTGTFTINNTGTIQSNYDEYKAIYIAGYDEDSSLGSGTGKATVINSGTILSDGSGIGIEYLDSATITNNAGGRIESGYYNGIYTYEVGDVTINNSGTIVAYNGDDDDDDYPAIYIGYGNTATVNNYAGGIIEASSGDAVYIEYTNTATVNNYGTIQTYNDGVDIYEVGTAIINNYAGGLIQSYEDGEDGVYVGYTDTVTLNNYGKIYSGCETVVHMYDVGTATINNYAGGFIQATEEEAIEIYGADAVTINNYAGGRIEGIDEAVYIYDVYNATVNNSGTIVSYNSYGIYYNGENISGADVSVTNSGLIQSSNNAVYIGYADTATVTNNAGGFIKSSNGNGISIEYITSSDTAEVTNSGTIQGYGEGIYIGYADAATVTNNAGGSITGSDALLISNTETATVNNYGLLQSNGSNPGTDMGIDATTVGTLTINNYGLIQGPEGIYIESTETASVNNYNGGIIQGNSHDGIYITGTGTATVTNYAGGLIQAANGRGIAMENIGNVFTAEVINSGTIQSYEDGVYIGDSVTARLTNNTAGQIQSSNEDGVNITNVETADVNNMGVIQGMINGVSIVGATGNAGEDAEWGTADDVLAVNVNNSGTIQATNGSGLFIRTSDTSGSLSVTNSGTISSAGDSYNGDGIRILLRGPNATAELTNTATGVISSGNAQGEGISMTVSYSSSSGTINNSGVITSVNDGISMTGYGEKIVNNNTGGVIYGDLYGIRILNGNATVTNYGTITSADGTAIRVNGGNNTVTLGTGSVINGLIRANNSYSDNYMILDGDGTINANQMQQFAYLDKTGSGTWTLTGDMDFDSSYNNNGHGINIEEGVLAFADRNGDGGVYTNSLDVYEGASLGYVVTATGSTGALSTYDYAYFETGSGILVIPRAGTYAAETIYPAVLSVGGELVNSLPAATSTSAFLSPEMVEEDGNPQVYDLILTRLSFTTGANSPGNTALGAALDGMYDSATGDMRNLLDELIVLPTGTAQTTLTQVSGGTHPAFQLLSFNGIGKYLGVLNNHIGMGGAFAGNNQGSGFAWQGNDQQLAMAGGGNSMSDVAPVLLAAVGNIGQTQIATGTNWGFWIDGYASIGNRRSDELISKYKQTLIGGMMGFDIRATENLFLGISGGISRTKLEFDELMDNGYMDSYHGSVYLCYNGKPWYAEGVFTYARNSYDLERFITVGSDTVIASSDYYGNEYTGYAEAGYKFDAGGVIIRPLAAFQLDFLTQDAFKETGAGILNLDVEKRTTGSYQSFLGINVSSPIKIGSAAVLTPELRLKWAHEFSNDGHLINARFEGAGSGSFTIESEQLSRDTAVAGVGLNLRINKNLAAYVQYDAELNRDFVNHTGLLGLRFDW